MKIIPEQITRVKKLYTQTITALAMLVMTAVSSALSSNADLSGLMPSAGTLSPAFDSATISYAAAVANATASMTVTPTATDGALAAITVNGNAVISGNASLAIPLSVGLNTITTIVTAEDAVTTKTYTLSVTRAPSSNADLSALYPDTGTFSPVFASGTISYTATVPNAFTSMTVTPTATDALATITVNGNAVISGNASLAIPLNVGTNTITTIVTAEDTVTTKTYTLTVTRAADSTLSGLATSAGTLSPTFDSGSIAYTISLPNAIASMTVTPTATDPLATINVNTVTVASGSPSGAIALNEGANVITTVVTATDLGTKTYTITVTRAFGASLPVIYEPFNYATGQLTGKGGTTDVGLTGTWTGPGNATDIKVVDNTLTYNSLPTSGRSIGNLAGFSNRFGGARPINTSALAANGLLNDGATLWFSLIMGYGRDVNGVQPNMSNARLGFALANSSFSTGNNKYWVNDEGAQRGSGLGMTLGNLSTAGAVKATQFRDLTLGTGAGTSGDGTAGNLLGNFTGTGIALDQTRLIVAKITWGATSDKIDVYMPDANLNLGPVVSTYTTLTNLNQSTFDTITWAHGDPVVMDEIRFGATYGSVIGVEATHAYWDLNGADAESGSDTPSGVWNASNLYWNGLADGTFAAGAWAAGNTAIFSAGADAVGEYSVTVDSTQDIGGLRFENGTVTISGGTALRMMGNSNIDVASGLTATVATVLSEDVAGRSLTKIGSGKLEITGTNIYSGSTIASAGILLASTPAALPGYDTSAKVIFGGGTVAVKVGVSNWTTGEVDTLLSSATKTSGALGIDTTSGDLTQWTSFTTSNLGSTLGLTKLGTNTLTLDLPNTFAGVTLVKAGNLAMTDPLALQNSALDTSSTGVVTITGNTTPTFGGLSGASGNLADVLSADYSNITALTLRPQSGSTFVSGGVIGEGAANTTLLKTGAGMQILQGANTYAGSTTVTAGTLSLSGVNGSINQSSSIVLNGGKLLLDSLGTGNNSNRVKDTADVTLSLGGELQLYGSGTTNITENMGMLAIVDQSTVTVLSTTAGRVATLASSGFARTGKATSLIRGKDLGGVASATQLGKVTLTSTSGLSFVGASTLANAATGDVVKTVRIVPYLTGGLTSGLGSAANASTLITYDTTLGFRALSATNHFTLLAAAYTAPATRENVRLTTAGTTTITAASPTVNSLLCNTASTTLSGNGTFTVNSGVIAAVANTIAVSGFSGITLGDGTWNEGVVHVTPGATLTLSSPVNVTGSGGLTKGDTGTLILNAIPAYVGDTTVNSGTLQLKFNNPNNNDSTATIAASGATLNLNFTGNEIVKKLFIGTTQMADGVYGSGNIVIPQITGSGKLIVDNNPPTLAPVNIVDDQAGGPIADNTLVNYTVTFSEDMDASTVTAVDFANAGTSTITIGTITEPTPGVFNVQVTALTAGTLQLMVNAGAELKDFVGFSLNTVAAILDEEIITVNNVIPTLSSGDIVDNKSGAPVSPNTVVTYTVTFSEDMDASTVSSADFSNAGTSSIAIGAITEITPGVFTVVVTPTSSGTLQLQVPVSAELKDLASNNLDNDPAIVDDTTITVIAGYASWASTNTAGVNLNDDHDNDGVSNGVEYFLGGPSGTTTGFTALPSVVKALDGTLSVTWP